MLEKYHKQIRLALSIIHVLTTLTESSSDLHNTAIPTTTSSPSTPPMSTSRLKYRRAEIQHQEFIPP